MCLRSWKEASYLWYAYCQWICVRFYEIYGQSKWVKTKGSHAWTPKRANEWHQLHWLGKCQAHLRLINDRVWNGCSGLGYVRGLFGKEDQPILEFIYSHFGVTPLETYNPRKPTRVSEIYHLGTIMHMMARARNVGRITGAATKSTTDINGCSGLGYDRSHTKSKETESAEC